MREAAVIGYTQSAQLRYAGAANESERSKFKHQQPREGRGGHSKRPQRPKRRASLLKREAYRGIDDEQADHEGEKSECGQVEMKTVGQTRKVICRSRRAKLKLGGKTLNRGQS